ncbi:unknown [Clostridium sp. CAG:389]|nr:unknown [Clostridium sp. CAG:389]
MLAGNVTKIDKEAPKSFTPTTSSTTNSITVVANTTDQTKTATNGESGMEGYRFSKDEGKTWTEWQTNGTYKFNDMLKDINGSTYNIVVQAKDKAQNITTSTIVQATTAKNMEYYINEKDKLLATILNDQDANTRLFFKDSSDGAIVAMAYTQVENSSPDGIKFDNFTWLHPILVSTTENGAKYYGDSRDEWYNQSMNDIYDFEYKGVKYYCSSMTGWVVMGYNEFFSRYTTTFKTLNESTNPYKNGVSGPKEAGLALVKKYLGE